MMKKFLSMTLVVALITGFCIAPAFGQCTKEQMENKARQVAAKMEKLKETNDMEYRFQLLRFNNKAQLLDVDDIQAWCQLYDQMLLEL